MLHDEEYFKRQLEATLRLDGGPGSGNHGHKGVKGQRGGSAPGDGSKKISKGTVAIKGKVYTYESAKKEFSTPHKFDYEGMKKMPDKTIFIDTKTGTRFKFDKEFDDPENGINGLSIFRDGKWYEINPEGETWDIDKHDIDKIIDNGEFIARIYTPNIVEIKPSKVEQKRIVEAKKYSKEQTYDELAPATAKEWGKLSDEQKSALKDYTSLAYASINEGLRFGDMTEQAKKEAEFISAAIENIKTPKDYVVSRTCDADVITGWLKRNPNDPEDVKKCLGMKYTEKGFCSTTAKSKVKDGVFPTEAPVTFEIFVPKGSKGIYAEMFSRFGGKGPDFGGNTDFNGKIPKNPIISEENELLLQKNSNFMITSIESKMINNRHKYFIRMTLVSQGNDDPLK